MRDARAPTKTSSLTERTDRQRGAVLSAFRGRGLGWSREGGRPPEPRQCGNFSRMSMSTSPPRIAWTRRSGQRLISV
ncbi:hypothetical protein HMPREF9440_01120 [Sutterella parvirubra YIT 11816]|uniref:Uncharacterized protein n=1 Tax=Sutterella parvirubra YIT 11816 TaxID=762967 RepID=H3KEF6_9BURK|nr:hypothetical protein HMPREF9440_01120 [Sutterella parvirubra YIT 11816]